MSVLLFQDDRGAMTSDWVALTAGIVVLGIVVAYAVMGNSHAILLRTFDQLNQEIDAGNAKLAAIERSIDINQPVEISEAQ